MPEEIALEPALVAGLRADVSAEELGGFFGRAVAAAASGIPPGLVAGPVVAVYHRDDGDRFDVTIGLPVAAADGGGSGLGVGPGLGDDPGADLGLDPGLDLAELPGGPALRVTHHGDYPGLRTAYAELDAALAARGIRRTIAWEAYLVGPGDDPDPAAWVTTVTVPLG